MTTNKMTNMEVKKKNRNRIYRYMCKAGIVSNPDIAYELKLSLPTVTQNTKELIEMGLIEECGELESTGGRKAKALSVTANFKLTVGIDITRNHIGFLLANLKGQILKYERVCCPFEKSEDYFRNVNEKMEDFLEESQVEKQKILGIGISFPGIVDLEKKEITNSHVLNVRELSFSEVERFFSYPCVFFNDANAGAYAEGTQMGEDRRFFYLSLSNTVGGAVYNNGKLVYGSEFRCGEVGHMTIVPEGAKCYCGKEGCLDSYCAAKRLTELAGGKLEDFFDEIKKGTKEFVNEWDQYTNYLSIAINNIHMVLDCDIMLGGYVGSYVGEYISDIRKKVSDRNTFSEDGGFVKECSYKVGAAALGAALYVIEMFIEQI
nr:ROK family transcriptional regulator [uncultured Faecalimonas sp.]